jgi:hypothetical protein
MVCFRLSRIIALSALLPSMITIEYVLTVKTVIQQLFVPPKVKIISKACMFLMRF